jgi:RHS repeat-associated protein
VVQDGTTRYVTGSGGLPLEQVTSTGSVYYYHLDQLGSVRAITDSTGTPQNTYAFDPYGNVTSSTAPLANPFGFAGQYLDTESGLYYLRARYYDPSTGQFISPDPAVVMTREAYTYTADNPLNATDPLGLDPHYLDSSLSGPKGKVPGVTDAEQEAKDNHDAGFPYDKGAYNSYNQKMKQAQKYKGDRKSGAQKDNLSIDPAPWVDASGKAVQNSGKAAIVVCVAVIVFLLSPATGE